MAREVFISKSTKDDGIVNKILERIEKVGIKAWIAPRNLPVGRKSYPDAIVEAIEECTVALLIFSKNAQESEDVKNEIHLSKERQKTIITLRIEATPFNREFEYYLSRYQWVDAVGSKFEEGINSLVEILKTMFTENKPVTVMEEDVPEATMIKVTRESFQMGNQNGDIEGRRDEKPVHTVKLTYDFWIGKYDVTFNGYDAYCNTTGKVQVSDFSSYTGYTLGRGQRPVINVSWWDAIAYCDWLSKQEGLKVAYDNNGYLLDRNGEVTIDITRVEGYRLPTEAEWEYVARGGQNTRGYKYSGSNDLEEVGWYWKNAGEKRLSGTDNDWNVNELIENKNRTHPVGKKKSNEMGLYDLSGNVWEWCHDWYGGYPSSAQTNPLGPVSGSNRAIRGGSWSSYAYYCRVTNRYSYTPANIGSYLGFRVVRTAI